jgi:hypothetical protein
MVKGVSMSCFFFKKKKLRFVLFLEEDEAIFFNVLWDTNVLFGNSALSPMIVSTKWGELPNFRL